MSKKRGRIRRRTVFLLVWLALIALLLTAVLFIGLSPGEESVQEVMRDGVLHENDRVSLFGLAVNPGLIAAFCVSGVLILAALLIRLFALPRFQRVPGAFQAALEWVVGFFSGLAEKNSPRKNRFIGAYLFGVGVYVFFGTLFELAGVQAVSLSGKPVSLSAPLADINGAIAVGATSYLVILFGGLFLRGPKGFFGALKDFSLPISMSFRLFGALLSGLLVTELVYHYAATSFGIPVLVGVLFTLLHALIQTYVLTTLVSIFYGEAAGIEAPKPRQSIRKKEVQK